jgi:hypothetical protein
MGKWRMVTEKKRDERTGKWMVKFFARSPDGRMFLYPSQLEAQQRCRAELHNAGHCGSP